MWLAIVPGISEISGGTTRTSAITVAMAPAVCLMSPPTASANRPSTVRYKIPPRTARVTPGWDSVTDTWLRRIVVLMKNTANTVIALTTASSTANTPALAASMGIRRGTASSEERIAPVEYSLLITITPSTQIASWPMPNPAPKITDVGSVSSVACSGWRPGLSQLLEMTLATSVLKPIATTTNASSDQRVDLTERIFVHSEVTKPAVLMTGASRRTRRCSRSAP